MLCVMFGVIESDSSGKKKKIIIIIMNPSHDFFIHCSTCMSRQISLPMNVADALQKKRGFVFSIGLSCIFSPLLNRHVSQCTASAQFSFRSIF